MNNYTKRPQINTLVIVPLKQDLRGNVTERAEGFFASLIGSKGFGKAEIDKLDFGVVGVVLHQNILWFEVSVHDSEAVEVVKCGGQGVGDFACSVLIESELSLFEEGEEVASFQIFHYNVDVVLVFKDVIEQDNIFVLTDFEDFNLSFEQLLILERKIFSLHNLNSDFFSSFLVDSSFDNTVLALTEIFLNIVVVEKIGVSNRLFDGLHPAFLFILSFQPQKNLPLFSCSRFFFCLGK